MPQVDLNPTVTNKLTKLILKGKKGDPTVTKWIRRGKVDSYGEKLIPTGKS